MLLDHELFFFFNDTATTEIYTLSLHDALPIWVQTTAPFWQLVVPGPQTPRSPVLHVLPPPGLPSSTIPLQLSSRPDRKSTRLNSSHANISYAVFCLKKKKPSTPVGTRSSIPDH